MYHSIWVFHCFKKRLQLHDQLVNSVGLVLRSLGSESPGLGCLGFRVQGSSSSGLVPELKATLRYALPKAPAAGVACSLARLGKGCPYSCHAWDSVCTIEIELHRNKTPPQPSTYLYVPLGAPRYWIFMLGRNSGTFHSTAIL